jgi:hypothetical protein
MKHNPLVTILLACGALLHSTDSEFELADPYITVWHGQQAFYLHLSARIAAGLITPPSSDSALEIKPIPEFLEEYIEANKDHDREFYAAHRNKKTEDQIKKHNQAVFKNRKKS